MINAKKDEATKAVTNSVQDLTNKVNVLDIKVEEDFDIDEI